MYKSDEAVSTHYALVGHVLLNPYRVILLRCRIDTTNPEKIKFSWIPDSSCPWPFCLLYRFIESCHIDFEDDTKILLQSSDVEPMSWDSFRWSNSSEPLNVWPVATKQPVSSLVKRLLAQTKLLKDDTNRKQASSRSDGATQHSYMCLWTFKTCLQ